MTLNNFFHSLEIDLQQAILAKDKVDQLFAIREERYSKAKKVFKRAEIDLHEAKEEFREASVLRSSIAQTIGELQGERFRTDEDFEDWRSTHQ